MRTRTMLILTILGSSIVAMFAFAFLDFTPSNATAVPPQRAVTALVAARPIAAGTLIRPDDVVWHVFTGEATPSGVIERPASLVKQDSDAAALAQTQIVGAVLRRNAEGGSPILSADVIRPGDRDFLVSVLKPDMRAIAVAVNAVSGAAGLIFPGDRVDVLLTQTFASAQFPLSKRAVGETVVEGLRVLAIDQHVQARPESTTGDGRIARTVTLEATPEQAQKIAVATELGRISLSIRSLRATPASADAPPTWADDVSPALRSQAAPAKAKAAATGPTLVHVLRGSQVETLER